MLWRRDKCDLLVAAPALARIGIGDRHCQTPPPRANLCHCGPPWFKILLAVVLLSELCQRLLEWSTGYLKHSLKRLAQVHNQKQGPGHRKRTNEMHSDDRRVPRRVQAETGEKHEKPEHQHHQKGC